MTDAWIEDIVTKLKDVAGGGGTAVAMNTVTAETAETSTYSKEHPFTATLLASHPLVTDEAGRMVQHIEIDLDESGLQYQVGDVLGVMTHNPDNVVNEILSLNNLSGEETITGRNNAMTIRQALISECDLNQLTPNLLKTMPARRTMSNSVHY